MLDLCLASLVALAGPPALPPVPGEAAPATETAPATPTEPASAAIPVQSPVVTPTAAPAPAPVSTATPAVPPPEATAQIPPQPVEVAGPPASAPVVVAPRPVLAPEPIEQPRPTLHVDAPRYRGRGMLLAAGVLGTVGFGLKLFTSVVAEGDPFVLMGGGVFYNPIIGTSLGLLGGGMGMLGRYHAHRAMFDGEEAPRRRRTALGWGLFSAGVGVWAATRAYGILGCSTTECMTGVWEGGYYLSLAATVPGIAMGAYGSGYQGYERRFGHLARRMTVAPLASRDAWGLSISGRF